MFIKVCVKCCFSINKKISLQTTCCPCLNNLVEGKKKLNLTINTKLKAQNDREHADGMSGVMKGRLLAGQVFLRTWMNLVLYDPVTLNVTQSQVDTDTLGAMQKSWTNGFVVSGK